MTRTRLTVDVDYGLMPQALGFHATVAPQDGRKAVETSLVINGDNGSVQGADALYGWLVLGIKTFVISNWEVKKEDVEALVKRIVEASKL